MFALKHYTYNCVMQSCNASQRSLLEVCMLSCIYSCTGQPEQITLQFKPSRNFPLDVYFLLDVTGSFSQSFRDTVTPLATELGTCTPSTIYYTANLAKSAPTYMYRAVVTLLHVYQFQFSGRLVFECYPMVRGNTE